MQTAQFVAAKLNNMQVCGIVCPQSLRMLTDVLIAYDFQVVPVKDLRERHLGVLEGLTRTQAALQFPADFSALGSPDARPQVVAT